jgi:hypothetical protein
VEFRLQAELAGPERLKLPLGAPERQKPPLRTLEEGFGRQNMI